MDQFEKSKVLTQFLDILGTNSGNTIMLNSLHYTYKVTTPPPHPTYPLSLSPFFSYTFIYLFIN